VSATSRPGGASGSATGDRRSTGCRGTRPSPPSPNGSANARTTPTAELVEVSSA
jgi:hypothetical protein